MMPTTSAGLIDPERLHVETDLRVCLNTVRQMRRTIDFLDKEIPHVGSLQYTLRTSESHLKDSIDRLDRSFKARDVVRQLRDIDDRLASLDIQLGYTVTSLWPRLRKDESFDDFKFVIGKILKRGWKLEASKADPECGTVDYNLSKDGAYLSLYVSPGDSEHCRIVEANEVRTVTVKKIVCDGVVTGEMAGAQLVDPKLPQEDAHDDAGGAAQGA